LSKHGQDQNCQSGHTDLHFFTSLGFYLPQPSPFLLRLMGVIITNTDNENT